MSSGDWEPKELEEAERLYVDEGEGPTAIAKVLNRPLDSVKTKIKTEGWTRGEPKIPKKLTKPAQDNIIVSTAKKIADDAKEVHEELIRVGKFVYGNYSGRARSKGISLEEYIEQVTVFHDNYYGLIDQMQAKIREQKKILETLTVFLSPVPYKIAILEEMVRQEGRKDGRIYSDEDIAKYLDAVNLVLDLRRGGGDGEPE